MNPCFYCCDHFCCRAMCRAKKDYLDFIEGDKKKCKIETHKRKTRKLVISINKNGIRKEEYI